MFLPGFVSLSSSLPGQLSSDKTSLKFTTISQRKSRPEVTSETIAVDANLSNIYDHQALRQLQFRFMKPNYVGFSVESTSGVLQTNSRIDREVLCPGLETCLVRLDVGIQPNKYFRIIRLTISIADINDNTPVFPDKQSSVDILESTAPGSSIPLPVAVDLDSPPFSIQSYRLESFTDVFKLMVNKKHDGSSELKLVLVKSLDRETKSEYNLSISALDGGSPPRIGSFHLHIRVLDANDNHPVFQQSSYQIKIRENIPVDTVILQVHATDADLGLNAEVAYAFSSFTGSQFGHVFQINRTTGEISTVGNVDFEYSERFVLTVEAVDSGPDPVSSAVVVNISVDDVNDNAPEVSIASLSASDDNDAEVPEDALIGTFVAHLTVSDKDSGDRGRFNCSLGREETHFRLKRLSESEFQIVTQSSLDREVQEKYDLIVTCTGFRHSSLDV